MSVDGEVRKEVRSERSALADDIFSGLAKLSVAPNIAAAAAALWVFGSVRGDNQLKKIGERILIGLAISEGIVTAAKWMVDRKRPAGSDGQDGWRDADEDDQSFPSGHTANYFVTAVVVSRSLDSVPVSLLAYGLAGAGAIGRLERGRHWTTDVITGAAVGCAVGAAVTASNLPHIGTTENDTWAPEDFRTALREAGVPLRS